MVRAQDPTSYNTSALLSSLAVDIIVSLSLLINGYRLRFKLNSCEDSIVLLLAEVGGGANTKAIRFYFNAGLILMGFYLTMAFIVTAVLIVELLQRNTDGKRKSVTKIRAEERESQCNKTTPSLQEERRRQEGVDSPQDGLGMMGA